jgi:hypothetical protein
VVDRICGVCNEPVPSAVGFEMGGVLYCPKCFVLKAQKRQSLVGILKALRETVELQIGETRSIFETIRDELDRQIEELRRRM